MPTYEYQCKLCGHQTEVFQKIADEPLTECPTCHQAGLSKLVSATAFQLKGTGWYATDYRHKGKAPAADAAPTKPTSDASKKSDTPATPSSGHSSNDSGAANGSNA